MLFLFLISLRGHSQSNDTGIYNIFDKVAGLENSGLYNGVPYFEQHRTINDKHKFFLTREFIPGFLLYNEQPFPNTEIKYNIYDGVLLARAEQESGATVLQLINEKVDKFIIGDHIFVNLKDRQAREMNLNGFYEELLKDETLGLYKKYSKQINQRRDNNMLYYEFDDQENDLLLYWNESYHTIDSRRDVQRLFPDLKPEIKTFYRSNRSLRRSNKDSFMSLLFQEISLLVSEEKMINKWRSS